MTPKFKKCNCVDVDYETNNNQLLMTGELKVIN